MIFDTLINDAVRGKKKKKKLVLKKMKDFKKRNENIEQLSDEKIKDNDEYEGSFLTKLKK